MQIVLLEDVKSLGKKGEIVKVNEGYGRNFILPKKLGVEATAKDLNDLKLKKANEEKVAAKLLEEARELGAKLEKASVTLSIKAGENAVQEQLGLDIDKKKLVLADPIKTLGTHEVPVKLHRDVTAKLSVKVVEA